MLILIVNPFLSLLSNYGSDEKQRFSNMGLFLGSEHLSTPLTNTVCPLIRAVRLLLLDTALRIPPSRFVLRLQQSINAFGTAFAGKIRLNGGVAQVLVRNVPATNGVLHGIDAPLVWDGLPPRLRTEARPPCPGCRGLRTKFTYKTPYELVMKWEGGNT